MHQVKSKYQYSAVVLNGNMNADLLEKKYLLKAIDRFKYTRSCTNAFLIDDKNLTPLWLKFNTWRSNELSLKSHITI